MVSRLSLGARKLRKHPLLPSVQELEPRRLLSSFNVYGTSGDDHIVITFDPLTGKATVSGASNVPDGTVFPASVHNDRQYFYIEVGDGNDYVEIGREPQSQYGYYDASRALILGGAGNDELIGGDGKVTLDGGTGNDKLSSRGDHDESENVLRFGGATSGVHVNLADGKVYDDGQGGIDEVSGGIGGVEGTRFDDKIYAGGLSGWFDGFEGNDLLVAAATNDRLSGMSGGVGDDTLIGGDSGVQFYPGRGNDLVIGGTGGGILRYDESTHGALVRLDLGVVEDDGTGGRDIVSNIDQVEVYSKYADTLYGNDHANYLFADAGDNLIVGGGGDDYLGTYGGTLLGGGGNDTLVSSGADRIDGGAGADLIQLWGFTCSKTKIVSDASDTIEDNRVPPTEDGQCEKKQKEKKHERSSVRKKHAAHHRAQKKSPLWQGRRWGVSR